MKTTKSSSFLASRARFATRLWGVGCVALGLSCFSHRALGAPEASGAPGHAPAAPAKKAAGPGPGTGAAGGKKAPVTVNVAQLSEKLKGSDTAQIQKALSDAKAAGRGAAPLAPLIDDLLKRGSSVEISALAIAALGEIGNPNTAATLHAYAHHLRPELRKKATSALIKTGGPQTVTWMREGLSDPDPGVRGIAASGIGTLKGHDGLNDLFTALDHQVNEAAASIGQLCTVEECERFAGKTGKFGLDVMTSGFDQILFRPTSEIPDDEKIKIVARVRELGTQEANKYLRDLQSRLPASGPGASAKVKQAVEQAVLATAGSQS